MKPVSRRKFLKEIAPPLAVAAIAGLARVQPSYALSSPSQAQPSPHSLTASYVISVDSSLYVARNGQTGEVEFSGPEASEVIQSALNAVPQGGTIFLKRGVYGLNNSVTVPDNIQLTGERGASIRIEDGAHVPTLAFNGLEVVGDNVSIEGLEIDGNASGNPNLAGNTLDGGPANPRIQCGILTSGSRIKVLGCYVHDTWNAGLWIWTNDTKNVSDIEVAGCVFERCGKAFFDSSSTNRPQSANSIYAYFGGAGSTSRINVHHNHIIDSYGAGIYYHFTTDSNVDGNIIRSSLPYATATAGIALDDYVENVNVRGNNISGHPPGIYVVWAGTRNIIVQGNQCSTAPNADGSGYGIIASNTNSGEPMMTCIVIDGNICRENALAGILVSASNTIVSNNICCNNQQATGVPLNERAGICIQGLPIGAVAEIIASNNRCFDDQDDHTQLFGVAMSGGSNPPRGIMLVGNNLRANGVGAIGKLDALDFRILRNDGYNPLGIAPIEVGPSPFTYTNQDGVSEAIYIWGGRVSRLSKDSVPIFNSTTSANSWTIWLEPGESVVVSYASAPLMLRDRK